MRRLFHTPAGIIFVDCKIRFLSVSINNTVSLLSIVTIGSNESAILAVIGVTFITSENIKNEHHIPIKNITTLFIIRDFHIL